MKITEEEFLKIIDDNSRQLQHLCRSYTSRREERKDLYQEIIIQVWQSLESFKSDAKLSTWIYRIGVNTAISFNRKKRTRKNYHKEYRKEEHRTNSITQGEKDENKQIDALYDAIASLNTSEKAIISMYMEDFSYAEISYVTGITENYVGVKLNRIKKKLSNILGD